MDSQDALRLLRDELKESNPNVGAYREFAAVDVRLNPGLIPEGDLRASQAGAFQSGEEPTTEKVVSDGLVDVPSAKPSPTVAAASAPPPAPLDACLWCREELPKKPNLRFCPWCGTDIRLVPCAACGEEVEPEWRFCTACGAEVIR